MREKMEIVKKRRVACKNAGFGVDW